MVSTEMAPIEESLKAMLVDIVRRCQSTVVLNYGRINSPQGGKLARPESSSFDLIQTLHPTFQSTSTEDSGPSSLATIRNTGTQESTSTAFGRSGLDAESMRDFFEEPPSWNPDLGDNSLDMAFSDSQNLHSDSGYASVPFFCECPNRSEPRAGKLPTSHYYARTSSDKCRK